MGAMGFSLSKLKTVFRPKPVPSSSSSSYASTITISSSSDPLSSPPNESYNRVSHSVPDPSTSFSVRCIAEQFPKDTPCKVLLREYLRYIHDENKRYIDSLANIAAALRWKPGPGFGEWVYNAEEEFIRRPWRVGDMLKMKQSEVASLVPMAKLASELRPEKDNAGNLATERRDLVAEERVRPMEDAGGVDAVGERRKHWQSSPPPKDWHLFTPKENDPYPQNNWQPEDFQKNPPQGPQAQTGTTSKPDPPSTNPVKSYLGPVHWEDILAPNHPSLAQRREIQKTLVQSGPSNRAVKPGAEAQTREQLNRGEVRSAPLSNSPFLINAPTIHQPNAPSTQTHSQSRMTPKNPHHSSTSHPQPPSRPSKPTLPPSESDPTSSLAYFKTLGTAQPKPPSSNASELTNPQQNHASLPKPNPSQAVPSNPAASNPKPQSKTRSKPQKPRSKPQKPQSKPQKPRSKPQKPRSKPQNISNFASTPPSKPPPSCLLIPPLSTVSPPKLSPTSQTHLFRLRSLNFSKPPPLILNSPYQQPTRVRLMSFWEI